MRIKEIFNKKINVAWVTAVLILIAILTICVATSHSKYVLEKELTFSLGIIESDEWNKRTLITGEELNGILTSTGATQVVFGKKADFSTEIESVENSIAVGVVDETKSFAAEDIKLYTVTDTEENITTAYILSEYQIKANADSSKMFYTNENEDATLTLTNIYFLNFETTIVENMESMFEGCENLVELDLSKFETAKVTNISRMFYNCNSLEKIYASELWDISGITTAQDDVFYNCTKLVGGNGTTYNEENPIITSNYACIDTAENGETSAKPGYFTYKSSVTEQQVTFNLVRPSATEKTDKENTTTTTNTNTTTSSSDSSNETNTNKDNTKNETETNTKTDTNTDTDTDTESDNTDSNDDTSLDDNTDSNDSNNTTEELEDDKKDIEPVEDEEKIEDDKDIEDEKEETTEENVEDNGAENTSVE